MGRPVAAAAVSLVGDLRDARRTVADTVERFGGVDVLVNNAATFVFAPTHEFDEGEFDRVVGLNYRGTYLITQAVVRQMLAAGGGSIVNVTTVGSYKGFPGGSVYSSSKAAVENLTKAWAVEYGPHGINVNAVVPGMIVAPMSEGMRAYLDVEGQIIPTIPRRRLGTTADVAAAVLFLLSDEADYITGASVPVDGGGLVA